MSKKKAEVLTTPLEPGTTHADISGIAAGFIPLNTVKPIETITAAVLADAKPCTCGMTQAEKDHRTLAEADKIRRDSQRFMAAEAFRPLPN